MNPKNNVSIRAQHGAVIAEFIVVSGFVLVSVLGLTSLLGKMIDSKHKVEQASRYSSWERTVWFQNVPKYHPNKNLKKNNTQLQTELHHRVFANADTTVDSTQHLNLKDIEFDRMHYFHDRGVNSSNNYQTMYVSKSKVQNEPSYVRLTQNHSSPPGKLTNVIGKITKPLDVLGDFKVNREGYYTGDVTVEIKEFKWLKEFKGLKPEFSSKSAILTDGWNAGGPPDMEGRVRGLLPLALLDGKVGNTIQKFAGFLFDPLKPSSLELGKVTSEPVPSHRLRRYPNR